MSLALPAAAVDVEAVGPAAAIEQLAESGRARRGDRRRADQRAGVDALWRVALLLRNGMRLEGVVLDATADAVALWIEPDDVAQVARAEIVGVVRRGQLRAPTIAAPGDRVPANRLALRRAGDTVAVVAPLDLARRWDIERLRARIEALL